MGVFQAHTAETVDLIAKGLKAELEEAILKRLRENAEPILRQAAVDAARNITGRLAKVDRLDRLQTVLHVEFNKQVLVDAEAVK